MTARVLVVDDILANVRLLEAKLTAEYFEVVTAMNGVDALESVQRTRPDIILLDVEMPRMDGYEFAAHVRSDPEAKDVPIIMITSRVSDRHKARAIELGVNDYLGKPYQETKLLGAVNELLGREE